MIRSLCFVLLVPYAAFGIPFQVQEMEFGAPSSPSLATALSTEGIIAVTKVPGLAAARKNALVQASKCVLEHNGQAPVTVVLKDRTVRSSWAAHSNEVVANARLCPDLQQAIEDLRQSVQIGTKYFISRLDSDVLIGEEASLMSKVKGGSYTNFRGLLSEAVHLDHVHVYEKRATTVEPTLEFHTDQGLFICIVPAIRFSRDGTLAFTETNFIIETRSGRQVAPIIPDNGDALVFMMGDGVHYLSPSALAHPLRPVPHALKLDASQHLSARAWMGRMFFAPSDALLNDVNRDTFQSVINQVVTAREANLPFPSLSCSHGRVNVEAPMYRMLHDVTGNNCTEGTAFCWMACVWKGDAQCAHPKCLRPDGTELPDGEHNGQARLKCVTESSMAATNAISSFILIILTTFTLALVQ